MYMLKLFIISVILVVVIGCTHKENQRGSGSGIDIPVGSKLILPPGGEPNPALCCGSCDANNNCENCAVQHPFTGCQGGTILACPEGEILTEDGSGACA